MQYKNFKGYAVKERESVAVFEYSGSPNIGPSKRDMEKEDLFIYLTRETLKVRICTLIVLGKSAVDERKILAKMPVIIL